MESMSNEELLAKLDQIKILMEKRAKNQQTINIQEIISWDGFDTINNKNIHKIKNTGTIRTSTPISGFYYNNLSLVVYLEEANNSLYLLKCIEEKIQCESDSSYDHGEGISDSDGDIHVSKIVKQYYLTKSDLYCLLDRLEKIKR
jgi:hypothetical protein